MKRFIAVLALLCSIFSFSQPTVKALSLGDTLPDLSLSWYDTEKGSITVGELPDGPLIIDFWATNCTNCIKSMRKIDTLQKIFGSQVSLVLAARQSPVNTKERIEQVFESFCNAGGDRYRFPFVIHDTVLRPLFPHPYLPYLVWIDGNRVIRHFSDGDDLTEENIRLFLSGQPIRKALNTAALLSTLKHTLK